MRPKLNRMFNDTITTAAAYRFNNRVFVQPILHKEAVVHYGLALGAPEMSVFDSEISEREPTPAPPRVRKEFPETWLWEMVDVNR